MSSPIYNSAPLNVASYLPMLLIYPLWLTLSITRTNSSRYPTWFHPYIYFSFYFFFFLFSGSFHPGVVRSLHLYVTIFLGSICFFPAFIVLRYLLNSGFCFPSSYHFITIIIFHIIYLPIYLRLFLFFFFCSFCLFIYDWLTVTIWVWCVMRRLCFLPCTWIVYPRP